MTSGFAIAIAIAPLFAVVAGATPATETPIAQCPDGEEPDFFTLLCVPHTSPGDDDDDDFDDGTTVQDGP